MTAVGMCCRNCKRPVVIARELQPGESIRCQACDSWARALDGIAAPAKPTQMLSTDSAERKATPIMTGMVDYFPLACAAVARLSKKANEKHNPGQPVHWSRDKSTDHADCIVKHLVDRGTVDPELGELHEVAAAWRALALCEIAEEQRLGKPPSRGSK